MPVEFCCVPVRCEGHFGNDSTLERRPAREKLRTVDHQRLFGGTERLFCFCGWTDCRAWFLKIQRRLFRDSRQELTRGEYERLVAAAEATGDRGLALLMETICSTGIRVSEVQYITVEAAKNGKTEIALKGKIRTILLPSKFCRKLLKFATQKKPPPARSFAPKAAKQCQDIKSGQR